MRRQGRGDYDKRDDYDRQFHSSGGDVAMKVGLLTADLSAPAAFLGTPTTATAQPYKVTTVDGTPVADGDPITLRNYHPGIAGENGDYFVAVRKWGMWVVIDVDYCPPAA